MMEERRGKARPVPLGKVYRLEDVWSATHLAEANENRNVDGLWAQVSMVDALQQCNCSLPKSPNKVNPC